MKTYSAQQNISDTPKGLEQAIIAYVNTFENLSRPCNSLADLYDGVILMEMLSDIQGVSLCPMPAGFNAYPTSFAVILSNLKAVNTLMDSYTKQVLKMTPSRQHTFDLIEVAKEKDKVQIGNMFLKFLDIAIQSENKPYFIEKILTLPQDSQALFANYIRQAMVQHFAESPTKCRRDESVEKKLLEKLDELQTQNYKLQAILKDIAEERQELERKLEKTAEALIHEQNENERLNQLLKQNSSQNQPREVESAVKENTSIVQNLKKKLLEVTRTHEQELSRLQYQLETEKAQALRSQQLEEQLEYFQDKYEECKQYLIKYEKIQQEKSKLAKTLEEKEDAIKKLKQKISENTERLYELEEREVYDRMELEKKNIRIEELYKQIENLKNRAMDHLPLKTAKSLSEICPEINHNSEFDHLKQHNQTLLADLQKSTKKIRSLERELQRYKRDNERLALVEAENKKLEEILVQYSNTRGEENEILVGCLYELRLKYKELYEERKRENMGRPVMRTNTSQNRLSLNPKKYVV